MSPRPRLRRHIRFSPNVTFFKPQGVPMRELDLIELNLEEIEAVRLTQYQSLSQIEAAEMMKTSQSSLQRILSSALKKIATALVEGKAIKITTKDIS